jgi:hypothetical protein
MFYINDKNEKYNSFIYKWIDKLYDKYYIGSHLGSEDDGYKFSGLDITKEYKNRSDDFYRIILSYHLVNNEYELRNIENEYLKKLDVENNDKYYNRTNEAYGGHHITATWIRKNVVGEDGLTSYQRGAKKMVEVRKANNSFVTSKKKEYETKSKNIKNIHNKISFTLRGSKWVHNNTEQKLVKNHEFNEYINNGWKIGILNQNRLSPTKNRIAINKNGEIKYVDKSMVEDHINNGWNKGGIGKYPINKNGEIKYVDKSEINIYIDNGWNKGIKLKR